MTMLPEIRITKYKNTRFHAVWINEGLLSVVCYKKGAVAIRQALLNALNTTTLQTESVEPCQVEKIVSS